MTTDTAPKIIVVDDDPAIRNLVHRFFNQKYQVDLAADGETALALFEKIKPLLVVLDWNLLILQAITSAWKCSAVLMFLRSCDRSRIDEADKLKVLSAGADDYICKPFGLAELAISIEVVLTHEAYPLITYCIRSIRDRFSASGSNTQRSHYQVNSLGI